MRIEALIFFLLIMLVAPAYASKGIDTLSWTKFSELIRKNHPLMTRYNLLEAQASARMLQAWGNFEPRLSYNYNQKRFDGLDYYSFSTPEVEIPLWMGMELKGNFSEANGTFLNPENKLPGEGLSSLGINVPLGSGLLMDKRRAVLKKALIFKEASRTEQALIINDLMLEAGESYADWQNGYKLNQLYEKALQLTEVRFRAVKEGFLGGDRPAIDTVEALTQVQQRSIELQQASLQRQTALYELSAFLWISNHQPVNPQNLAIVPQNNAFRLPGKPDRSVENNPLLQRYDFKLRDLEIERRLNAENLRPTIDLQLGILNNGTGAFRNINPSYWQENNKAGLKVAFPLSFATARGEIRETKIKISSTLIDQSLKRNQLEIKLKQNAQELKSLQAQLMLIKQSLLANQKLLEGESLRFSLGDSSLFLINARETKLLEIQEKYIEIENKILKNELKAEWLVGGLAD